MVSDISLNEAEDRLPILPQGWVQATISDLIGKSGVFIDGDWVESKDQDPQGDIRLIQLADIGDGTFRDKSNRFLTSAKAAELNCTFLKENDVLTARMPDPLGRACIFPRISQQCVTVVDVCIVRTGINSIDHHWLMYTINSPKFRLKIDALQSGSTRKRISRGNLSKLVLPIPPLHEQHRIVTKIEELLTQLDAGVASLKKVQAQLKRYRQAVLKAAFEGRLTQEWREKHQTDDKHFLEYVEQNWEKYHKGKKFTKIDPSNLLPLPVGWLWSNFDQISQRVTVGHVGPMKEEYIDRGIPFLRSQNVRTNRFDPEGLKFISPGFHIQIKKSTLFPNDIVVVRSGNVGVSCVIPEFLKEANCSDLVIVKQPYGILPSLGAYYMNSTALRLVNAKKVGVALTHFNTKSMAEMVVPLPPIEEQKFLLAEIERLFSIADEIEQTITTSLCQSETLRHSILKRAFEGKLVPQDPNDEPASILLERIKAEKARNAAEVKKGKTLQPKSPKRKIKNGN